jgi:hypothetical protein
MKKAEIPKHETVFTLFPLCLWNNFLLYNTLAILHSSVHSVRASIIKLYSIVQYIILNFAKACNLCHQSKD